MLTRALPRAALTALVIVGITTITACAPEPGTAASGTPSTATSSIPVPETTSTPSAQPAAPVATGPVVSTTVLPKDCRGILTPAVLAQLEGVPLNDPAFGAAGVLPDGSLRCVWGDPGADTTKLTTTIAYGPENETIEFLNSLTADGYTCYRPDDGVRCEKTWQNATYPVTDGRTLYFRDNVLVDTQYSQLAPAGYTAAVVASVWPAA